MLATGVDCHVVCLRYVGSRHGVAWHSRHFRRGGKTWGTRHHGKQQQHTKAHERIHGHFHSPLHSSCHKLAHYLHSLAIKLVDLGLFAACFWPLLCWVTKGGMMTIVMIQSHCVKFYLLNFIHFKSLGVWNKCLTITLTNALKDLDTINWRRRQLMDPGRLSTYSWYSPSRFCKEMQKEIQ